MKKYYLVALPEKKVLKRGLELQSEFSSRYGVYERPFPPLHMTLGIIYIQNQEEIQQVLTLLHPLLTSFLPFKLTVEGVSCFPPPYKSVNLRVRPTKKLRHMSKTIHRRLASFNISAHPMKEWDYHISLVNTVFANREWTEKEFSEACKTLVEIDLRLACFVKTIELWNPEFPPLNVIDRFTS